MHVSGKKQKVKSILVHHNIVVNLKLKNMKKVKNLKTFTKVDLQYIKGGTSFGLLGYDLGFLGSTDGNSELGSEDKSKGNANQGG